MYQIRRGRTIGRQFEGPAPSKGVPTKSVFFWTKNAFLRLRVYEDGQDKARSNNGEAIRGSELCPEPSSGSAKSGVAPMTASFRCLLSPHFTISSHFSNLDPGFCRYFVPQRYQEIRLKWDISHK